MISKYLILMSMTCAENAGNDPTSLAEAPLIHPNYPMTMSTALTDYSLLGYSEIFTSRRSLFFVTSCRRGGSSFSDAPVSIPLQTLSFISCPVHLVMLRLVLPAPRDLHHP